jgi:hypothetical protein
LLFIPVCLLDWSGSGFQALGPFGADDQDFCAGQHHKGDQEQQQAQGEQRRQMEIVSLAEFIGQG